MKTWYEDVASSWYGVEVDSTGSIIPQLSINGGATSVSLDNPNYANGIITFESSVNMYQTNLTCLGIGGSDNCSANAEVSYQLKWNISKVTDKDDNDDSDDAIYESFDDNLVLSLYDDLEIGNEYIISVFLFNCEIIITGVNYCNNEVTIEAEQNLMYEYSYIVCKIAGGDKKEISYVTTNALSEYSIYLDGNSFSYDHDSYTKNFDDGSGFGQEKNLSWVTFCLVLF